MKPKFISFEGSESCGKSTQIEKVSAWLTAKNQTVITLREPGGTALGECVRDLLKHHPAGEGMEPESELLLFAASRAELVRKKIKPSLASGYWVICDRFLDSTTIYQGLARHLNPADVAQINQFAVGTCLPSLTLILDLSAQEAYTRMQERAHADQVSDRMENEPLDFYHAVVEGYRHLAQDQPERVKLVPASGTREEVFNSLIKEICHAFPCLLD